MNAVALAIDLNWPGLPRWKAWLFGALMMDSQGAPAHSIGMDAEDRPDIEASLGGDGEAYARLVRKHQDAIAGYLRRFTRDRSQVEELVQETFVQAYLSLRSFRGAAPFEHWLKKIATRAGYRFWKQKKARRSEACDLEAVVDRTASPEEAGVMLEELLGRMSARDRLVLTLLYVQGHSVAEAAALSGWSQAMVKVQAFRARHKLKKMLQAAEDGRTVAAKEQRHG